MVTHGSVAPPKKEDARTEKNRNAQPEEALPIAHSGRSTVADCWEAAKKHYSGQKKQRREEATGCKKEKSAKIASAPLTTMKRKNPQPRPHTRAPLTRLRKNAQPMKRQAEQPMMVNAGNKIAAPCAHNQSNNKARAKQPANHATPPTATTNYGNVEKEKRKRKKK